MVQHSYTAPGDDHGITDTDRFYTVEVNGVTLVDWVDTLISGEPSGYVWTSLGDASVRPPPHPA